MDYREIDLLPSTVVTVTGNGATVDTVPGGQRYSQDTSRVIIDVTAAGAGTPSLVPTLQGIHNGKAYGLASHAAITGVGQYTFNVTGVPRSVRLSWVMTGGTPSLTFSATLIRQ